ncbi:hypothetical protein HY546_02060 [archaeon]|nr:hypothetical protein [archaeon]
MSEVTRTKVKAFRTKYTSKKLSINEALNLLRLERDFPNEWKKELKLWRLPSRAFNALTLKRDFPHFSTNKIIGAVLWADSNATVGEERQLGTRLFAYKDPSIKLFNLRELNAKEKLRKEFADRANDIIAGVERLREKTKILNEETLLAIFKKQESIDRVRTSKNINQATEEARQEAEKKAKEHEDRGRRRAQQAAKIKRLAGAG